VPVKAFCLHELLEKPVEKCQARRKEISYREKFVAAECGDQHASETRFCRRRASFILIQSAKSCINSNRFEIKPATNV